MKLYLNYFHTASKLVKGAEVDKDLESMAKEETTEDKIFQGFRQRISHEPEQVGSLFSSFCFFVV